MSVNIIPRVCKLRGILNLTLFQENLKWLFITGSRGCCQIGDDYNVKSSGYQMLKNAYLINQKLGGYCLVFN